MSDEFKKQNNVRKNVAVDLTEADARILKAVREVQFGSVEITIHNGRIVQVERREKIRLPHEKEGSTDAR